MSDAASRPTARTRAVEWITSPRLAVYCLALLMILTFWGTVYQVEHGLYAAQDRFFNSWFFLAGGFLPFPGTPLVLLVLTVNLVAALGQMLFQPRLPIGILLVHGGLLMMLIGGAITRQFGQESQLSLLENQGSNLSSSLSEWELAVWTQDGGRRDVYAADLAHARPGDVVVFTNAGLSVTLETFHRNARAFRAAESNAPPELRSRAGIARLEPAPPDRKEPGRNLPGLIAGVAPAAGPSARVVLFGEDAAPDAYAHGGRDWTLELRRKRYPMPFFVTLLDFQKKLHPGTAVARSFSSRVAVAGHGGGARELTISMNKPLRDRGFTLYQSSYMELPGGQEASVFTVTQNVGRLIPYVSTAVVTLGMLVHFAVMLARRARRRTRPAEAAP